MKSKIGVFLAFMIFFNVSCAASKEIIPQSKGAVKVIQNKDGSWQLFVHHHPYLIKGVVFTPVKIGEDPGAATMRNWMDYDDDHDGNNDIAFQTWVDENRNHRKDKNEKVVGDFQLLKEMGVNTIRLYHVASDHPVLGRIYKDNAATALQYDRPVDKELLRKLTKDYGIMVIMGNFLGSWTIGSGASWDEGTDYANPAHRENIKKSIRAMVLDSKDEPYVLMWLLGNENNIADWSRCNAKQKPRDYATLIGELAQMIHELDPNHPVAVSEGDGGINDVTLKLYSQYAPGIDIIAYNSYRGKDGFGSLWRDTKKIFDRPIFIAEFGTPAYHLTKGEDEDWQERYLGGCWKDIILNSAGYDQPDPVKSGAGNSIGGVVFDWLDRWYMDGSPSVHNPGTKPWNTPDGIENCEWYGIMSMGDGSDSLLRQKRKSWSYLKSIWGQEKVNFESDF